MTSLRFTELYNIIKTRKSIRAGLIISDNFDWNVRGIDIVRNLGWLDQELYIESSWLDVCQRIDYFTAITVYKSLAGLQPNYRLFMVAIQIFWESKAHHTALLDASAAPPLGRSFLSRLCSLKKARWIFSCNVEISWTFASFVLQSFPCSDIKTPFISKGVTLLLPFSTFNKGHQVLWAWGPQGLDVQFLIYTDVRSLFCLIVYYRKNE